MAMSHCPEPKEHLGHRRDHDHPGDGDDHHRRW
jgi:hypothetical protein